MSGNVNALARAVIEEQINELEEKLDNLRQRLHLLNKLNEMDKRGEISEEW